MADLVQYAYKGRGKVWIGDTENDPLRFMRNISSVVFGFGVEEDSIKDYTNCAGGSYASSKDISEATIAMTLHDLSPENFQIAFNGDLAAIAEATATEEQMTVPTVTDLFLATAHVIKESGTITVSSLTGGGGTVYTGGGDDYTVHNGGIQFHLGGTGGLTGGETVFVNYTKRQVERMDALKSASVTKYLQINGLNCAQSGAPNVIRVWKFQVSPTDAFELISESFASFTLNGTITADTSKTADSQYFQADVATSDA